MKERGIIFSAPMVRAILDGRKSQTRRPIKPQPRVVWGNMDMGGPIHFSSFPAGVPVAAYDDAERTVKVLTCPHGAPGDRLYVKETHYKWTGCGHPPSDFVGDRCYADHADYETMQRGACLVTVPSIFMPRWASRITLEIVAVRVERVNNISDRDCLAEGIDPTEVAARGHVDAGPLFRQLWNSIYTGAHGWAANPWVWAIAFRRVEGGK